MGTRRRASSGIRESSERESAERPRRRIQRPPTERVRLAWGERRRWGLTARARCPVLAVARSRLPECQGRDCFTSDSPTAPFASRRSVCSHQLLIFFKTDPTSRDLCYFGRMLTWVMAQFMVVPHGVERKTSQISFLPYFPLCFPFKAVIFRCLGSPAVVIFKMFIAVRSRPVFFAH